MKKIEGNADASKAASSSPWVRITLKAHEKDSWAVLNIPASEVVSGLWNLFSEAKDVGSFELEGFFANGDGVKVTLKRTPKK